MWDDYLPKEVVKGPGPKPKLAYRKPSLMRVEMATFNTKGGYRTFVANCTNGSFAQKATFAKLRGWPKAAIQKKTVASAQQ